MLVREEEEELDAMILNTRVVTPRDALLARCNITREGVTVGKEENLRTPRGPVTPREGALNKCKITANAAFLPASSTAIARNGYIQRFSYNCTTQYSRNNLRHTGFFDAIPETPPWNSPLSSNGSRASSLTSIGSYV